MKAATLTVLFFSSAWALCPNDCSGHGDCSHSSHCTCHHNWVGADCGQRICTFGRAFVDSPWGDLDGDGALEPNRGFSPTTNFKVQGINYVTSNVGEMGFTEYGYARKGRTTSWDEAHFYRECSNKGLCDRETGLCECFPGYTGSGCRRTACPQDCNGNGICRTILESNRPDAKEYSAWDGEKTQLCVCDPGWSGPACSMRSCPKGADPVAYNYKVTDSIQGIYFRTFAPDRLHVATEADMHKFLKDKPSRVFFTITFTDEYNDEWTTAASTVEYTTFCLKATAPAKGGVCLSTPKMDYKNSAGTVAEKNEPTRKTIESLAEHVNKSMRALPTRAAETYVWAAANPFDVKCATKGTATNDNDLRADVTACLKDNLELVPRAFQTYPWLKDEDAAKKDRPSISDFVDSLEYRLDLEITHNVNQLLPSAMHVNFDGTDTEVFGLGLFVKLPGPGVSEPLQVRYWYEPTAKLGDKDGVKDVKYSHVDGTSAVGSFTQDAALFLKQDLVVVQDLVPKRKWNPADGDSEFDFSETTVAELPYCSNRGICDVESGVCNCFSGYTGLRCDQQNAVTYSY